MSFSLASRLRTAVLRQRGGVERDFPPPAPDEALCFVGDLHGASHLLETLLALRQSRFPGHRLVFLGDAVDRGPDSAGTLRLLRRETARGAIVLAGNHEAMLLDFLDAPEAAAARWLRHGGAETLLSFGVGAGALHGSRELRDALREALGAATEAWLRALPLMWQSGNLVAAHAGLDPDRSPEAQERVVVLWGGPPGRMRALRRDGLWVASGHVVVERAICRDGRIALDTGAYATGRLSYALIDPAQPASERVTLGIVPAGPEAFRARAADLLPDRTGRYS